MYPRMIGSLSVVLIAACLAVGACKSAPRQRPVRMGPVDAGPGSVEAARRQLEGTWELVRLETHPAPGQVVPVDATARMTFDAFGNVKTEGSVPGGSAEAERLLRFDGQVVIDPVKKEWRVVELTGQGKTNPDSLPPEIAADKIRAYAFEGDVLKLSMRDAAGRVTANATWKRVQ
jgi:hypothetical protein